MCCHPRPCCALGRRPWLLACSLTCVSPPTTTTTPTTPSRYLVVLSQYRSPLNFNADALSGAKTTLKKLDRFRDSVLECAASAPGLEPAAAGGVGAAQAVAAVAAAAAAAAAVAEACAAAAGGLEAAMNDDLNTPRAGASLFGLLKQVQPRLASGELAPASAAAVLACLAAFNAALGVWYDLPDGYFAPPEAVRRARLLYLFLSLSELFLPVASRCQRPQS